MRAFVEVHGRDDDLMTRVYGRVAARMDTLFPIAPPAAAEPETPPGDSVPAAP
jgi:hypothetical protein